MEAISGMKIFEVRDGEWYVAPSSEAAVECVIKMNGCASELSAREDGHLEEGYPQEISEGDLDRMKVTTDDEEDENGQVGPIKRTFREQLIFDSPTEAAPFCSMDW